MIKRLIAGGVVLAGVGLLAAGQTGRIVLAWVQPTSDFVQCTADPRIWCEPGAEQVARTIAPLMAEALGVVERAHYGSFPQPVRVQVYASRESFARHSAVQPVAYGATGFGAVHGRHFEAEAEGSLLFPKRADEFKLSWPMYYRQSSMMVDYMKQRDGAAFEQLIRDVAAGKAFGAAVQAAYGQPLSVLWQDFLAGLGSEKKSPQA